MRVPILFDSLILDSFDSPMRQCRKCRLTNVLAHYSPGNSATPVAKPQNAEVVVDIIDINLCGHMMAFMRTTLTIDDDVAAEIEALRKRQGLSLRQAVDLLLRNGLRTEATKPKARAFRTRAVALGLRPGFDPAKLNQLADELESEAVGRKLAGRK